ncbi:hypothetical protein BV25DRAFT_1842886 [Artomyces pyxidatus]|uniref:Uncharacterized protein n=1 Tax=Artomyces pyxidatus TaxID=48021 RepID=A0ACB8SIN0_9AGAM|nr:hypothetical protein BV25DRAFT_1842886 [Artomyces pyxidatus]
MPALEKLVLIKCLPSLSQTSASPSSPVVTLPHLQYLELVGKLAACVDLFQHIVIPDTGIKLRLECTNNGPATDYAILFPLIATASGGTPLPLTRLEIDAFSSHKLTLAGRRSPYMDRVLESMGPDGADLELDLEWRVSRPWSLVDLLHAFCEMLSVADLRAVSLDIAESEATTPIPVHKFEYLDWLRVLASANNLLLVETCGRAGHSLCQALARTSQDGAHWQRPEPGVPDGTFFLPKLVTLKLYNVPLSRVILEERLTFRKFLPRLLQTRVAAGLPRVSLELSLCSQRMEEELKGTVRALCGLFEADSEVDHSGSDEE